MSRGRECGGQCDHGGDDTPRGGFHRRILQAVLPVRNVVGALVVGLLIAAARVGAHDLERTQVTLTFLADGAFVLDIANDPAWLLLRLETFAGGEVRPGMTSADRDTRLRALSSVFVDRIVLFVDGREIRPTSAEYLPPRAELPGDPMPPLATFRLHGRMPTDARNLRWLYGLVIDPYPLTIRRADGRGLTEWIEGSDWSGVVDLSGQFRQATRVDVVRDYVALGYRHILPKGIDHILLDRKSVV